MNGVATRWGGTDGAGAYGLYHKLGAVWRDLERETGVLGEWAVASDGESEICSD